MESESLEWGMELFCSGALLCGVESGLLSGGTVSELRGYGMESWSGVGSVSPADCEVEGDSCEHRVFCEGGEGRSCEDDGCESGEFCEVGICEGVS